METRQTFAPGQSVTVLTDDGFVFVGKIIACECEFECEVCDEDRKHHNSCEEEHEEDHKKKRENERERFLVLQLEEDVEVETGSSEVVFEEGDTVFINFDQIIAIGQGFPPEKKKGC